MPHLSLSEVGPRFVLNPVKIFEGSFNGACLYENKGASRLVSLVTPCLGRRLDHAVAALWVTPGARRPRVARLRPESPSPLTSLPSLASFARRVHPLVAALRLGQARPRRQVPRAQGRPGCAPGPPRRNAPGREGRPAREEARVCLGPWVLSVRGRVTSCATTQSLRMGAWGRERTEERSRARRAHTEWGSRRLSPDFQASKQASKRTTTTTGRSVCTDPRATRVSCARAPCSLPLPLPSPPPPTPRAPHLRRPRPPGSRPCVSRAPSG